MVVGRIRLERLVGGPFGGIGQLGGVSFVVSAVSHKIEVDSM